MKFDERDEGPYRIYAGAIEALQGDGWLAAVVVSRRGEPRQASREAYRDSRLAGGHRWPTADDALSYAIATAREVIRNAPALLAC